MDGGGYGSWLSMLLLGEKARGLQPPEDLGAPIVLLMVGGGEEGLLSATDDDTVEIIAFLAEGVSCADRAA